MIAYQNNHGSSGVVAYEIGTDRISIEFRSGDVYLYTYKVTGIANVERMKVLAEKGEGLSTYISRTVKNKFESKLI